MLSDISYDKTEDDLDESRLRSGRKWKRPTAPPLEEMDQPNGNTPPKRHKQVSQSAEIPNVHTRADVAQFRR